MHQKCNENGLPDTMRTCILVHYFACVLRNCVQIYLFFLKLVYTTQKKRLSIVYIVYFLSRIALIAVWFLLGILILQVKEILEVFWTFPCHFFFIMLKSNNFFYRKGSISSEGYSFYQKCTWHVILNVLNKILYLHCNCLKAHARGNIDIAIILFYF